MSLSSSRLVAVFITLALTAGFIVATSDPATAAAQTMATETGRQVNFIISRQIMPSSVSAGTIVDCAGAAYASNTACGAVLVLDGRWVNPYIANLAMIGLLRAPASYQTKARLVVKNWVRWFLNTTKQRTLSQPKLVPYTIPDYNCSRSACAPTGSYGDSVDSYTGTFLSLLAAAYSTGDAGLRQVITTNINNGLIAKIADTVVLPYGAGGVRKPGGLTEALPNLSGYQYTMDNAEVYAGLRDFSALLKTLGNSKSSYYQSYANQTRTAMLTKLWDAKNHGWRVQIGDAAAPNLAKQGLAPAGTAQYWPALFGVFINPATGRPDPLADENLTPWRHFNAAYKTWYKSPFNDPEGWGNQTMAVAARYFGNALGNAEGTTYKNQWTTYQLNLDSRFWTTTPTGVPADCAWKVRKTPCTSAYWEVDEAGWWLIAASSNPSMIPGT